MDRHDQPSPRHFPPHGLFELEAQFDGPLPSEASLSASLAGPQGLDGGPTHELHSENAIVSDDRRSVLLTGPIPHDLPAGTYRVTSLVVRWIEAPPSWQAIALNYHHLDDAGAIVIDAERTTPRPSLPHLTSFR